MIKHAIYILGMIALLLATSMTHAQSEERADVDDEPRKIVALLQNALLEAMQRGQEMSYPDREAFLAPVIKQTHDLKTIVRTILGTHWATLNEAEQQEILDAFTQNSIATYADRFTQYDDERFEIIDSQPLPRERVLVRSQFIKADKEKISFDYVLQQQNGNWQIINIVVDGVSDLALKRAEYSTILQQEGIQALIDTVQSKTNQIRLGHR